MASVMHEVTDRKGNPMLLSEFCKQNHDILLDRLSSGEMLRECTPGSVFFLVSVSRGHKPMDERQVLYAKHAMPVNLSVSRRFVDFLCLTDAGYAKLETICPSDLEDPDGYKILFRTRPMAPDDPRAGKHWKKWEDIGAKCADD